MESRKKRPGIFYLKAQLCSINFNGEEMNIQLCLNLDFGFITVSYDIVPQNLS